jgi:peptidoglycan/LPS O-acetylase OafA/YrhL
MPKVTLYIPVHFSIAQIERIGTWFRTQVQADILLDLKIDPDAVGGCAFVYKNTFHDVSFSYFVNQHVHEIGVRLALGATPGLIWAFVMRRGLAPIVVGLVVGIGLSLLTTTALQQQLYGVTPHDPLTLGGVGSLLLVIAVLAMYVPARRAMRVPPIVALNES